MSNPVTIVYIEVHLYMVGRGRHVGLHVIFITLTNSVLLKEI